MRRSKKRPGLLVCVELGATWPEKLAGGNPDIVRRVVAQVDGETPEAFASRAGALARRLFSDGVEVTSVVAACNERTDPAAIRARSALGGRLLEHLGPTGTFSFSADPRAGGRLRHALSDLALGLAPKARGSVTVHFGTEAEVPAESVARVA
jgi:hypothetical protein